VPLGRFDEADLRRRTISHETVHESLAADVTAWIGGRTRMLSGGDGTNLFRNRIVHVHVHVTRARARRSD